MTQQARIQQPWLTISRIVWFIVTAAVIWLWLTSILVWSRGSELSFMLFQIVPPAGFLVTSSIIIWRGGNRVVSFVTATMLVTVGPYLISGVNNTAAEIEGLRVLNALLVIVGLISLIGFLFTFPNGRVFPRWSRVAAPVLIIAGVLAAINDIFAAQTTITSLSLIMFTFLLGIAVQIQRYIVISTAEERQQLRWIVVGLSGMLVAGLLWFVGQVLLGISLEENLIVFIPSILLTLLFPTSIAVAILRYRLWDIDLIIQRTIQYAVLTVLLGGVYFGLVLLSQNTFVALTGQESTLAVVISTLAIAALFTPVRRRVQRFLDRAFFRQRYDAERTLAQFADAVRDEVDIDDVQAELVRAVNETMQPESIGLWLRETPIRETLHE